MKIKSLYHSRIEKLRKSTQKKCDALFVENPIDIFYLTGIHLSLGRLVVSDSTTLYVDGRYTEMCEKMSPFPVQPLKEPLEKIISYASKKPIKKIGFDSITTPFSTYQKMLKSTKNCDISLVPLEAPVLLIRAIKDPSEIQALKEAAVMGSKGYDYALSLLKVGVTEEQVALELEIFWRRLGSSGSAFDPIIAFGENSSMPHYRAGKRALRNGDIVLIDIGATLHSYHSDMTRTVFFGNPDKRLLKVHDVVREAQQKALKLCKPGAKIGDIDAAAREHIASCGYGEYFNHGLGHGIGLEVHELPVIKGIAPYGKEKLEEGMAITIEPGIYLPDIGGVRIEDTIVITKNGYENLTLRPTLHKRADG